MPGSPTTARAFSVSASFGPPLPGGATIFKFPTDSTGRNTRARVMYANCKLLKVGGGALLQSVTVHDPAGTLVFNGGLAPVSLGVGGPFPTTHLVIAGPEQARVPFFIANVLFATYTKDLYCLPGYELHFNNLGAVAGNSAVVTVFLMREGL